MNQTVVGFGEIMLRLATPGRQRLEQSLPGAIDASFGGGEANVCVSLARLGLPARYVTALPKNVLGDTLLTTLRGHGVDTQYVTRSDEGRLGIYFLETGANQRPSVVVYDRAGSCISQLGPDSYNFAGVLDGAGWLHVTGITPSLSEKAYAATQRVVDLAHERGLCISCDLNFRKKLWNWDPPAKPRELAARCMPTILEKAKVIIGNEEDAADVLGIHASGTSVEGGKLNAAAYADVAGRIAQRFPNCQWVAITLRESISADYNRWGGMLYDSRSAKACYAPLAADGSYEPYEIRNIVDRVGGGDSFAAGLIFALQSRHYADPQSAIRFAVAASCLKHSISGDFNLTSEGEVAALMKGSGSGRVQR
jgi:2-dehydro-3-deoxygluconokinase